MWTGEEPGAHRVIGHDVVVEMPRAVPLYIDLPMRALLVVVAASLTWLAIRLRPRRGTSLLVVPVRGGSMTVLALIVSYLLLVAGLAVFAW